MAKTDREPTVDPDVRRVCDAIVDKQPEQPIRNRLRTAKVWLFVDVSRWYLTAGLAVGIYATTLLVGVFGPASVQQYLLDGTSITDAYIDLQSAIITVIVIVLAINQLVLSPEFGSVGKQQQRLDEILTLRQDVEENADIISSPTEPPQFLRTITEATRQHLTTLEEATTDSDEPLSSHLTELVRDMREEIDPVSDSLTDQRFGQIELLGVSTHYNTNHHINQIRKTRRMYERKLTDVQLETLDTLMTAVKNFEIAREYFRTRYLQTQFIRFSNAILFTGLPGLAVAHYSVGVIGPDILTGTTFGIRNLLWFEAGTFTIIMIPVLVVVSYIARINTLAKTSILIGPFSARGTIE